MTKTAFGTGAPDGKATWARHGAVVIWSKTWVWAARGRKRPRPGAIARPEVGRATEPPPASRHIRVTPPAAGPRSREVAATGCLIGLGQCARGVTIRRPAITSVQLCSGLSRRGLQAECNWRASRSGQP